MQRFLALAFVAASSLCLAPGAHAQSFYNPYQQQYNSWNNGNSLYQGGSRETRREIRNMNPYADSYRGYQRQYRSTYR